MIETPHAKDLELFSNTIKSEIPSHELLAIVDCGAGDGYDARRLQDIFPTTIVWFIEADAENYESAKAKGVRGVHAAVWCCEGTRQFYRSHQPGIHSLRDRRVDSKEVVELEVTTLNRLFLEYGVRPQAMKLDVEGCAYEALVGMGNLLQEIRVLHVETETWPYFKFQHLDDDVSDLLTHSGMISIHREEVPIGDGYQVDSLWVRR